MTGPEGTAMKQLYHIPKLIIHGTVAEMTQALGSSGANDVIIWGRFTFDPPVIEGSRDCVIPCWPIKK
jgi:hypothetical protein